MNQLVVILLGVVISLQGWILLSLVSLKIEVARIKERLQMN